MFFAAKRCGSLVFPRDLPHTVPFFPFFIIVLSALILRLESSSLKFHVVVFFSSRHVDHASVKKTIHEKVQLFNSLMFPIFGSIPFAVIVRSTTVCFVGEPMICTSLMQLTRSLTSWWSGLSTDLQVCFIRLYRLQMLNA